MWDSDEVFCRREDYFSHFYYKNRPPTKTDRQNVRYHGLHFNKIIRECLNNLGHMVFHFSFMRLFPRLLFWLKNPILGTKTTPPWILKQSGLIFLNSKIKRMALFLFVDLSCTLRAWCHEIVILRFTLPRQSEDQVQL